MAFAPISRLASFSLPDALWLLDAWPGTRSGIGYRVIATYGLGSIIAFNGSVFYGVEQRPAPDCANGGLYLVSYSVCGAVLIEKTVSALLACAKDQGKLTDGFYEVTYAATGVKWVGPWENTCALFVAVNITGQ